MHHLEREIILNEAPEKVWAFLATPLNLNELTPPSLDFRILSDVPETMYNGLMITYEIKIPLFGRRRWLTEIKQIEPGARFVDEQRKGPYKLWIHEHNIEPFAEGRTKMLDRVTYQLPFGLIGSLVHTCIVEKMLYDIFEYREKRLNEMFNREGVQNDTQA